jgi:small subunit ribosomal protein S7
MGRRKKSVNREIPLDPIYPHHLVAKLINKVMVSGKKSIAQKQVYRAFEIVEKKTKKPALEVFLSAMDNIRPRVEVRSRRVGGAAYQVPMMVRGKRQDALAIRWLVSAARARPNSEYHTFAEKLAAEIVDASQRAGAAFTRKEEIEKVAEANRAFAHLRW